MMSELSKIKYYHMTIAGLSRGLPLCRVNESLTLAAFILFGDTELTVAAASQLLADAEPFDMIISAEAKGIPIAYEMSRQSGKPYLIARKFPRMYMVNPISVDVRSITTDRGQTLYIDEREMESMRGRRVLVVDDVISTGESLRALCALVMRSGGVVSDRCGVLAEGDSVDRDDIKTLAPLPLFTDADVEQLEREGIVSAE